MLGQDADEAFDRAVADAVNHNRALAAAVHIDVLQVEVQRHLEVQLNRAALPGTAEAVAQVEVNLRAVERAVALVDDVGHTELFQRGFEAVGRILPVLVRTHRIRRTGGQFDEIIEAELGVHLIDEVHDAGDFVRNLFAGHEDMGVILREAADAEQTVQCALQLVTVHQTEFTHAQGQVAVGMGLAAVDHHAAGAVHGLDAVVLVINLGGVHVVLVVIPVTGRLPQVTAHNHGRGHFHIIRRVVNIAPVVNQRVLQLHSLGQEEREAGAFVAEHEQTHFLADFAVVALFGFFHHLQVLIEFLLIAEGDAADAGEHLVVLVVLPVRAGQGGQLECLERLGVAQVRADAHVDVVALLVEGQRRVFGQVADVFDLVDFAALLHELDGVLAAKREGLNRQVLLDDGLHFLFDGLEVFVGELHVAQIDVVMEALFSCRAIGEMRLRIQVLDCLREDVCRRVADDMQLVVSGAFVHMTVIVDDFHAFSLQID